MDRDKEYKDIIKKWGNVGFLEVALNKSNVALGCELASIFLDEKKPLFTNVHILAFPAIVRIFSKIEIDVSIELIKENVINIIKSLSEEISSLETNTSWVHRHVPVNVDLEAEFMVLFCEKYKFIL